jgi:hypothetical protein
MEGDVQGKSSNLLLVLRNLDPQITATMGQAG